MTGWTSSTWSGSGSASRDTAVYRTGHASAKVTIPVSHGRLRRSS